MFENGLEKDPKKTSIINIMIGTTQCTDQVTKDPEKLKKAIAQD